MLDGCQNEDESKKESLISGAKERQMETMRVRALNVELGSLKKQVDKLNQMFDQENWNYNLLESQFEMLKQRNKEEQDKISVAEKKLKDSMEAADSIIKMAEETARNTRAQSQGLLLKAQLKYKEIEERLETAEKSSIKKHLKELESVTA